MAEDDVSASLRSVLGYRIVALTFRPEKRLDHDG